MSIEYSKIDMDVRIQYENEPKYGLHEVTDTKSGETLILLYGMLRLIHVLREILIQISM